MVQWSQTLPVIFMTIGNYYFFLEIVFDSLNFFAVFAMNLYLTRSLLHLLKMVNRVDVRS